MIFWVIIGEGIQFFEGVFGVGGTASISFGFVIRGHDFLGGGLDNSKLNSSIIKHVFSFCTQNQLLKIEYSIVNSQ